MSCESKDGQRTGRGSRQNLGEAKWLLMLQIDVRQYL
jgi:hypothetical protein